MLKYNRNYYFIISTNDGSPAIKVGYPLTLDFTVSRNTMGGIQDADFTIYNLGENTRKLINKNTIDNLGAATQQIRTIQFYAGYGPTAYLPLVFQGLILTCNSVREEGSPDWQTNISCQDPGLLAITNTAISVSNNQRGLPTIRNVITQMNQNINQVNPELNGLIKLGVVGNLFNPTPSYTTSNGYTRSNAFTGDFLTILGQLTGGNNSGGNFFFENQILNILQENEVFNNDGFPTISSATGLLGSPYIEQTWIFCNMLFEPRVKMGQLVNLQATGTSGLSGINGQKKVVAYNHSGVISGSVTGKCHTQIQLYANLNSQGFVIVGEGTGIG